MARSQIAGHKFRIHRRWTAVLRNAAHARGREFDEHDNANGPRVAVVNQSLANLFWPSGDSIGSTLLVSGQMRRVVGIVKDVPLQSRGVRSKPYVYVPYRCLCALLAERENA